MTTLVTGAAGQLGRCLTEVFSATGEDVVAADRGMLDVTNRAQVEKVIGHYRPRAVVHAAAMTDVDACERDPVAALTVNALGAWWVAQACARVGARLLMISTDYVFGGSSAPRQCAELDPTNPINAYGRSKAMGEILVQRTVADHQIVRTAWLAGAWGQGFVSAILRAARQRAVIEVVDDQIGSPTYTRDLAEALIAMVDAPPGIWHQSNQGACSRFELASAVVELAGLPARVVARKTKPEERPARRPARVLLSEGRARAHGLAPLPPWRDGLERLLAEMGELRATRVP